MTVFYSMVYVLLSEKYPLIDLSTSSEPLELRLPRIFNGTLEQGTVYVVSNVSTFDPPKTAGDYVFIFYETEALGIKLPSGTRAILIGGCHDPISAFESLTEIFIRLEQWETEYFRLAQSNSPVSKMLELFYDLIPQRLIFEDENYKHIYEFPSYDEPPSDLGIKYATNKSASPSNPGDASYQQFSSTIKATEIYSTPLCPKVRVLRIDASQSVIISRRLYDGERLIGRVHVKYDQESTQNINLMDGYCHLVNTMGDHLESKLIIAFKGSINEVDDALHNAFNNLMFNNIPYGVLGFLSELG